MCRCLVTINISAGHDDVYVIVDVELMLQIEPEDYMHLIKPDLMVKIYLKGTVVDNNNRSFARQDSFVFTLPPLEIKVNLHYWVFEIR